MDENKRGFIFLHGLSGTVNGIVCSLATFATSSTVGLGMTNCIVKEPTANERPNELFPCEFKGNMRRLGQKILGKSDIRSWFDFTSLPKVSIASSEGTESKEGLEEGLVRVEREIIALMMEGIYSQNIVLMGHSQGGCLALYTALHTSFKIGGFIAASAWLPLLKAEPVSSIQTPINKETPIVQINGGLDYLTPWKTVGKSCETEMNKVFNHYTLKESALSYHENTVNTGTTRIIRKWIQENINFGLVNL